jgi:hypothetical protein
MEVYDRAVQGGSARRTLEMKDEGPAEGIFTAVTPLYVQNTFKGHIRLLINPPVFYFDFYSPSFTSYNVKFLHGSLPLFRPKTKSPSKHQCHRPGA